MAFSYNKLKKLFIDEKWKKDLQDAADVNASVITKLGRDEPVTTTILMKICAALRCDTSEIMKIVSGLWHL